MLPRFLWYYWFSVVDPLTGILFSIVLFLWINCIFSSNLWILFCSNSANFQLTIKWKMFTAEFTPATREKRVCVGGGVIELSSCFCDTCSVLQLCCNDILTILTLLRAFAVFNRKWLHSSQLFQHNESYVLGMKGQQVMSDIHRQVMWLCQDVQKLQGAGLSVGQDGSTWGHPCPNPSNCPKPHPWPPSPTIPSPKERTVPNYEGFKSQCFRRTAHTSQVAIVNVAALSTAATYSGLHGHDKFNTKAAAFAENGASGKHAWNIRKCKNAGSVDAMTRNIYFGWWYSVVTIIRSSSGQGPSRKGLLLSCVTSVFAEKVTMESTQ